MINLSTYVTFSRLMKQTNISVKLHYYTYMFVCARVCIFKIKLLSFLFAVKIKIM